MTFDIDLTPEACSVPNHFDEGVELSFRVSTSNMKGEWIPLVFYVNTLNLAEKESNHSITVADSLSGSSIMLRGYTVPFIDVNSSTNWTRGEVHVCGEEFLSGPVEFRWLQTSVQQQADHDSLRGLDVFSIDNVTITSVYGDVYRCELLTDDFENDTMIE